MTHLSQPFATVAALYRYPVKGLSAEPMSLIDLTLNREIAHDRSWAIEDAPGKFDPTAPRHLPKINFAMLMRHEELATLNTAYNAKTTELTLNIDGEEIASGRLATEPGRTAIETALAKILDGRLRGRPKIVTAPGHSFSDVAMKCVHIINKSSLAALESEAGCKIDPLRFRANVVLRDAPPWSEFEWVGRTVQVGTALLKIEKRTERCAATEVEPESGARNIDMLRLLRDGFGHTDFGVYARVVGAGQVRPGDQVSPAN